jgi:hypothetical protein
MTSKKINWPATISNVSNGIKSYLNVSSGLEKDISIMHNICDVMLQMATLC